MIHTKLLSKYALEYLVKDNALDYQKPEGISTMEEEVEDIANFLCGVNNVAAIDFMNGYMIAIEPFMNNVKHNTEDSVPHIVRAIQLHLQANT